LKHIIGSWWLRFIFRIKYRDYRIGKWSTNWHS